MSSTRKITHPALGLFKSLFDEQAKDCENHPYLPTYFVPRSTFFEKVHAAGIEAPRNIMLFMQWEQSIGLRDFAHKVIAAHHKARGTDFTPLEKAAWRFYQREKRLGLPSAHAA